MIGTVDTGEVRQQLDDAIQRMQAGLVERDTEVADYQYWGIPNHLIMLVAGVHCKTGLVKRKQEQRNVDLLQVRLMLLAALSGEHILFIGPPGTAKSELGRRLSRLYKGTFFERLLTRFSVPEVRLFSN